MKMIRKLRKLRALLLIALMGSSFGVFAQTHVYITGTDTGTNSNCPAPPAGTPAANKVTTFYAAIQRANAVGGNVVIHLRTNQLRETSPCPTIKQNVNVQVINDTPARKAIRYNPEAYEKSHRLIPVNGTLTLGGEGCTSVLIVRGQPFDPYYYPYNEDGEDGETIPPVVLIKANEGTVNIENNCEVCYGRVNVWISYKTGVVNLREGGVIHSALDMNVNVTQGTFNMEGGYIMGHYYTSGNTVPDLEANPILDRENFLAANFTKNGTMDYHLDQYDVSDALEAYYPIDTTDDNSKINSACGVYVHCHKDGSGKHLAKFNMSGGSICGIYGKRIRQVIEGASGTTYQYYTNPETEGTYEIINNAVYVNGGECNISGGYIYANHTGGSGGGIILTSKDFDDLDPNENYEHTHFNMTGGVVKYCSGGTGGALRIEYGATATMSGGALTHCVSVPGDLINDTTNAQRGGGGGIRMVSSKFTMSGDAEISWCHSPTISEAMNGGGIGAVWQPGFGYVYTTLELHGGSIHHNRSESYGGGVTATDKGNVGVVGGIAVTIKGCSIHDNYAAKHGAGIYIGGNSSVYIDKSEDGTTKAAIYNNVAERNGGGVFVSSSHMQEGGVRGLLDSKNCDFYNNSAINGGGIYTEYADVKVHAGTHIFQHDITGNGAGVCIAQEADYFQDGGIVGNTTTETANKAAGKGGGFYVKAGNVIIEGGDIKFNTSSTDGGGGYLDGGSCLLEGGNISDNVAVNGAGMYLSTGTFYLDGGYIDGNDASQNGGGVFLNGGDFYHKSGNVGRTYDNANTAQYGAGVFMQGGNYTMTGGYNYANAASSNGGGVYMDGGDFLMKAGTIGWGSTTFKNTAVNGAGVFMNGGSFKMKNGYLRGNYASGNGGGVYSVGGICEVTGGYIGQSNNSHNEAVNGGGIYSAGGVVTIDNDSTAVYIEYNKATNGGGIYTTAGGSITIEKTDSSRAVEIRNNEATNNGGGVFAGGMITISGGNVLLNKSAVRGGGVYVDGGTFNFNNGVIGGTTAEGNRTTGSGSFGGGLFMNSGTANIAGGTISGNQTDRQGQGGGIYMNGGTCTLSNGATIGGLPNGSLSYANSAKYGGGIYSAGGTITVKGGKIQYNTASTAGGGIYTNGADGVVNMEKQTSKADMLSYIEYNTAEEGGGIYANRGVVNFSDGFIQYNHASNAGGGIYVNDNGGDDYGTLYLKGSANLRRNNVPEGHSGGGVYLKGKVVVGEQTANLGVIKAQENFAGDEYVYEWNDTGHPETDSIDQVTANNRNNIYLPDPGDPSVLTNHRDVITVIENGISLQSNVGFSVPHNYVPVIYCAPSSTSQDYLDQFSTGHEYQYMLFDDTRHYVAVHYPDRPDIFDRDHVYLYGFWANVVTGNEHDMECPISAADFEGQDPIEISDACELAFFISWVNGLNGLETHADANAILLADIDMSKYGWVPIGDLTHGYSGTFDGNGHTVTGISSLLYREYQDYGFFGRLDGGTVKDLFVKDASYVLDNMPNLVIGGLVGEITTASTVENCEVSSRITATNTTTVVGGLIGRMNAGTVHSTIGISDMKGYLLGGLVGELLGGSLYNSFSNCKYTKAESHDKYMGGLAAVNRGTVENCYARLRGSAPTGNFGILVGDNTGGVVNYCYAPAGMTDYKAAGANPTGHGNYGDSFLPYLYGHRDT